MALPVELLSGPIMAYGAAARAAPPPSRAPPTLCRAGAAAAVLVGAACLVAALAVRAPTSLDTVRKHIFFDTGHDPSLDLDSYDDRTRLQDTRKSESEKEKSEWRRIRNENVGGHKRLEGGHVAMKLTSAEFDDSGSCKAASSQLRKFVSAPTMSPTEVHPGRPIVDNRRWSSQLPSVATGANIAPGQAASVCRR